MFKIQQRFNRFGGFAWKTLHYEYGDKELAEFKLNEIKYGLGTSDYEYQIVEFAVYSDGKVSESFRIVKV